MAGAGRHVGGPGRRGHRPRSSPKDTPSKYEPFHGYYFKILKGQGPAAPLGEMDFVVKGAMIGGFALVAAPAEYRVTGVKTFIVSHDGIVYEKDLGPEVARGVPRRWSATIRTRPGRRCRTTESCSPPAYDTGDRLEKLKSFTRSDGITCPAAGRSAFPIPSILLSMKNGLSFQRKHLTAAVILPLSIREVLNSRSTSPPM